MRGVAQRLTRLARGGCHRGEHIEHDGHSRWHNERHARGKSADIKGEIWPDRVVAEVNLDVGEVSPDSQEARYQPPTLSARFPEDCQRRSSGTASQMVLTAALSLATGLPLSRSTTLGEPAAD